METRNMDVMRTEFEQSMAANSREIDNLARQLQTCMEVLDPAKEVRVVVACEDEIAAAQASLVLEQLGSNFEANGRFIYSWWNYEALAITALKKVAALEASVADMIAFAAHDGSKLPEDVIDWISQWLAMGKYHARALVAILDSGTKKKAASRSILSQLGQAAQIGQMDFFATRACASRGGRNQDQHARLGAKTAAAPPL
jgi:hypothetical protein